MTVTVTPTVEPSTGPQDPPRVRLDVTGTGETSATITRLDPDGRTQTVRTLDGEPLAISGGVGLLYDYEVPFGAPVSYLSLESPATVSAQVTLDSAQAWLIHPGIPVLSQPIVGALISSRRRAVERAVYRPMGRRDAVVRTDGQRKSAEYTLTVRTGTLDETRGLEALLDDAGVLLLNVPASFGWGITAEYVSVGDVDEDRLHQYGPDPRRHWQLPCTVVSRPPGGSTSERTYTDVLVDNTSYASLLARYPSYLSLLAGP